MSLSRAEQIQTVINDKDDFLITFRKDVTGDAIASALALSLFLEKHGKNAEIVVDNFSLPKKYQFLEGADKIQSGFEELQNFIIAANIKDRGLKNISYETKDDELRIYINPEEGMLDETDLRGVKSEYKYDLIFTVDTQSLDDLGEIHEKHSDLFHTLPIVNIDHNNDNEHFGHINFIDITSTSTVEMIYNLINNISPEYLEEDIATNLLTGLISKTKSFKGQNVSPSTLDTAGKLMNLGADRDYIVENLFRTRSVAELKLWGQALAHLEKNKETGLVWTTITREDFSRSGATKENVPEIIEELIQNSPEAKLILLLFEVPKSEGEIEGILSVDRSYNAKQILKPYKPQGSKTQVFFSLENSSLKTVEEEVTERINSFIKERYSNF
ncbi:MAG: bifunctional oligoribonuclease/PAP phosphatase NrnA [Candidatus Magasanikbacteria bacterium]